jgi:hypothetical protein
MTDHAPNTYLASRPNLSRRQARWSGFLQRFNTLTWHYKPFRINVADPVSISPLLDNASVADLAAAEWKSWLQLTSRHGDQKSVAVNAIQCAPAGSLLCNLFATQIVTSCEGTDIDLPLASYLLDRIRAGYAADPRFGQFADKPDHRFTKGLWRCGAQGAVMMPADDELRGTIIHEAHRAAACGHLGMNATLDRLFLWFSW